MANSFDIGGSPKRSQGRKKWFIIGGILVGALLIGLVVGLIVGLIQKASPPPVSHLEESFRIDCYPEASSPQESVDEEKCEARGCIYDQIDNSQAPACYWPQDDETRGFKILGSEDITHGKRWTLEAKSRSVPFVQDNIKRVNFSVEELSNEMLRFKFEDADDPDRFQVPILLNKPNLEVDHRRYSFIVEEDPFAFKIIRTDTKATIWDTSAGGLTFSDQFLQISTHLPTNHIYGFGENVHNSLKHDTNFRSWPMWARDEPPGTDEKNLYSVHPFYECVEEDGKTHGVFLFNSNAMEYSFTPAPILTYRTIGGILDFYVMFGPSPENVIQQYTSLIGRPYMPPYWSLGFHLSRYGFKNTTHMRQAVERTIKYEIPFDTIHADINYMDGRRDFTLDKENFGDLPQFITELQDGGMRAIIILDPCIEIGDNYEPYLKGLEREIYVKWPNIDVMPPGDYDEYNRTDMMGFVWPSWKVVFPDFMDPRAEEVWTELIVKEKEKLNFDGIWVDMNEPANFDTNNEKAWNWPHGEPYWTLKCSKSKWDDPPYRPKAAYHFDNTDKKVRLSDKTLCMQGIHANGTFRHYDVHSLYGHIQTEVTLRALRTALVDKRGLVLTRSTYPGSGKSAGRWLGDNESAWNDLRLSIIGSLEFNLFGIPYIGADICGFFEESPAELCKRWMQLGAFYTFSRNHNHENPPDQDPGYYGDTVAIPAREAMRTRYQLLPYLYTLFHKAHTQGGTVMRPMFHEFPTDSFCLNADRQFLWGPALLISPILEEKQTSIDIYLPRGRWYDYYSGKLRADNPGIVKYDVNDDSPIQLHIRGGYILPLQEPANNTHFSRTKPFRLKVALDGENGKAEGDLFWDDGESIDTFENNKYYSSYLSCSENQLKMVVQHNGLLDEMSKLHLDRIDIMGVAEATYVYVNNATQSNFTFNTRDKILSIGSLSLPMDTGFILKWSSEPAKDNSEFGRVDCCPNGCMEVECGDRDCLWKPSQAQRVPWCYFDKDDHGYNVRPGNINGNYSLQRVQAPSLFGGDIENLSLVVDNKLNNMMRVKIYDPENARFEVPIIFDLPTTSEIDSTLVFDITNENPLAFTVRRSSGGKPIWNTSLGGFTFADQFLQIAAKIDCRVMFGLGEHIHPHLAHDFNYQTWPMFTRDQPPGYYGNLYSVHPFYMCVEDDGKAHGVLFVNSHAMEVTTLPDPGLVFRTIGGILDFFFIAGNSPEDVIQKYTNLIGKPYLPPYWALGFHLSRYGYNSIGNLRDSLQRNIDAKVPVDVQHLDIDTLDERKDFTYDIDNFEGLPDFTKEIRTHGIKSVMILDPFLISNETNYAPYEKGMVRDVYIKWPEGANPDFEEFQTDILLGWSWPKGRVVYPDFFHPNTSIYWEDLIVDYYSDTLTFDGIWLDMNDPANFDTNKDRAFNWPEDALPWWTLKCPNSTWDDPPYKPYSIWGDRLSDKTICMNTLQGEGRYKHYDVHSLYGWSQIPSTVTGLQKATGHRGLTLSRSTYPGSGKHVGHWLGDNASIWPGLKDSIVGMIEFNLFGISFVGADICGYFNDAEVDLCQRWQQLGAFYTFARNHQGKDTKDQDPAHYGGEMLASTKHVLEIRYTLLPYIYSQFFDVHKTGGTVIKSLLHEFPDDKNLDAIDRQFMFGPALMVSPVLEKDKIHVRAYFPEGRWFDYHTNYEVQGCQMYHEVMAPMDTIPLHIRGGHIMVTQSPEVNTMLSRKNPIGLIVAPDEKNEARVQFYWDDGESIDTYIKGNYYRASITYSITGVKITVDKDDESMGDLILGSVKVLGLGQKPSTIKANAKYVDDFKFFATSKTLLLNVKGHRISMRCNVNIEFQS